MQSLGCRPQTVTRWFVASLIAFWPATLFAGSFGDYKEEKHDSSGGTHGASVEEDETDAHEEDDESVVGAILSGLAATAEDDDHDVSGSTETNEGTPATRFAERPCHYRTYSRCLSSCHESEFSCRQVCRDRARRICGAPARWGGTGGAKAPGPTSHGSVSGGFGLVQGGAQGAVRGRIRWNHLGFGAQSSILWNSGDYLVETDLGPSIYAPAGHFEYGFRPSLMISGGNGVDTLYGAGLRSTLRYERRKWYMASRPLAGYIGRDFNLQMRTGLGFRFTEQFHLEVGHDFRFVADLTDGGRSSLHGGYATVGIDF